MRDYIIDVIRIVLLITLFLSLVGILTSCIGILTSICLNGNIKFWAASLGLSVIITALSGSVFIDE